MAKYKTIDIKGKPYVTVSERVLFFNETYKSGYIFTEKTVDEGDYVEFKATVIPNLNHPERKFTGHSQATWGDGLVNKTSALENAETSAVGRALGLMGIGVIDSIASADEIKKTEVSKVPTRPSGLASTKQLYLIKSLLAAKKVDPSVMNVIGYGSQTLTSKQANEVIDALKSEMWEEWIELKKSDMAETEGLELQKATLPV